MSYAKQYFKDGNVLGASQLNNMDNQIYKNESSITTLNNNISAALQIATNQNTEGVISPNWENALIVKALISSDIIPANDDDDEVKVAQIGDTLYIVGKSEQSSLQASAIEDYKDSDIRTAYLFDISTIGEEVFSDSGFINIFVYGLLESIGSRAFADCNSNSVTNFLSYDYTDTDGAYQYSFYDTEVAEDAFEGCESVLGIVGNTLVNAHFASESLEIPDFVTALGYDSFSSNHTTEKLYLNNVLTISDYYQLKCENLKTVELGNFTNIGRVDIIFDLRNIEYISSYNNPYYSSNDGVLFDKDRKTLLMYPGNRADSTYTIPSGTEKLASGSMDNLYNLVSIIIPNTVTSIAAPYFGDVIKLQTFDVAEDNTKFSSEDGILFNKSKTELIRCPQASTITEYVVPDSVRDIYYDAFKNCSSLTSITIKNPKCDIWESPYTIPATATIYGYAGSKAEAYATKYNRTFIPITE